MLAPRAETQPVFLSTLPASRGDWRLAVGTVGVSAAIFIVAALFAKVQLPAVWGFIPTYQSALVVNDLVTAVLLYAQFAIVRSRALLLLASGYLFAAAMAVVHMLTFPGLFAETGLLGAGPQSTAWLYMFWHVGFPALVIGYALLKAPDGNVGDLRSSPRAAIAWSMLAVAVAVGGLAFTVTAGHDLLPAVMRGSNYTPILIGVVLSVWSVSLAALLVLWFRRPHCVLDVWLMVVMCAWLFDIALAAMLNAGRFDFGFYAGRAYGLAAASFVLVVLLLETGALYGQLARLLATVQRQAADEISQINATLQTVLDSSPLAIFSLDSRGLIATWNRAAERVFGYSAADVIGKPFATLPQHRDDEHVRLHQAVMAGEVIQNRQIKWVSSAGPVLEIAYSGAPVHDLAHPINGAVYIAEDVTDKRKLERQLAQSQKMEAVGQLTGGIAHDFNNLLTVVVGNLDTLAEELREAKPRNRARESLADDALTAALRGADLVRHMLAFSRQQPLQPRSVDIRDLLKGLVPLLRRALSERIAVLTQIGDDLWPIIADPSQLENAVLNLSINARDAMPDGGTITIACSNTTLDQSAAAFAELEPGDYVCISVIDTGSGIAPEHLSRVFEPFFSTKEAGKGTGLGLSMVYGFARQSGGRATIYSEVGRGTEVRISLPRSAGVAKMPAAAGGPAAPAAIGGERILVVEDRADVRKTAVAALENLGYRTRAAENAEAALAVLERGERFDVLFTDVVMFGKITGVELAQEVRRRFPRMPIVLTSGFSNPETVIAHAAALGATVISKPYSKASLGGHLREVLARASDKTTSTTASVRQA